MLLQAKSMGHIPAALIALSASLLLPLRLLAGREALVARLDLSAGASGASQRGAPREPAQNPKAVNPSAAANSLDACALLTSAEIEAILDRPVKETQSSAQPTAAMC